MPSISGSCAAILDIYDIWKQLSYAKHKLSLCNQIDLKHMLKMLTMGNLKDKLSYCLSTMSYILYNWNEEKIIRD